MNPLLKKKIDEVIEVAGFNEIQKEAVELIIQVVKEESFSQGVKQGLKDGVRLSTEIIKK